VELKKGRKEKVATSEMVKDEKFLFSLEERGIKATAERYGMSYGRVHYIVRAYGLKFKVLLRGRGNLDYSERNKEIMRLRDEKGLTLQAIGDTFELTRERVRQIIDRY